MSSRRLVNRGRTNENSSPAQRSRHREPEAAHEPTPLPPYEPPSCALTPSAKRALDNLRANHDYSKYKRHLDGSIKALTNSVGDSNERLRFRKEVLEKAKERRARAGDEGEGKTEAEEACRGMESNVATLTRKAEQALRELIDYGDELAMKDTIMGEVSENVAAAPPPRPARRQRRQGSHEDENGENEEAVEEDEDPEVDESIVSAVELLKKAQEEYAAEYAAKSMRARYSRIMSDSIRNANSCDLGTIQTTTGDSNIQFTSLLLVLMVLLPLTQELGSRKTIRMVQRTLVVNEMQTTKNPTTRLSLLAQH